MGDETLEMIFELRAPEAARLDRDARISCSLNLNLVCSYYLFAKQREGLLSFAPPSGRGEGGGGDRDKRVAGERERFLSEGD